MAPRQDPVWLEVALNGPWTSRRQPHVPLQVKDIVADGIACVEAGAAIVHVHARDPESGRQRDDPDLYAAIIEGIREHADAVVYPTIPLAGPGDDAGTSRYACVAALARRGLLEWAPVDPGSVNFAHEEGLLRDIPGSVYVNPEPHIRSALRLAAEHGLNPSFAIYEPGFLRLGAALAGRHPLAPQAVYRLMFSDGFRFGFPPAPYAVDAYLELLRDTVPDAPWMIAGLAVDVLPLAEYAVERGGHVRVGLEDAPFGSELTNYELAEAAVELIERSGGRLATPAEIRQVLAG